MMNEKVASVDSLIKLLHRLEAESIKQACIQVALEREKEWDEALREIGWQATKIETRIHD